MASNLYGNPSQSSLTSAYNRSPYGDAIDPGQVASATNTLPSAAANINYGGILSAGMSAIGGLWSAAALEAQNDRTISDLRYMFRRNRERIIYDLNKQEARDKMSFWTSGVTPTSGSAAGVLTSNRNIVMNNIADMEYATNRQIENLESQTRNKWISSIISGASNIVGAAM